MIGTANVFRKVQIVKDVIKKPSSKRRFRTSFDSQHVNTCQTLVKSAWEQLYHNLWSLWEKMTWKISPLLNFEILGVFVNTLTADENYPFWILGICCSGFKCNYLKNRKFFLKFLFHLWNLHQILNIFEKKMIVIANAFPKLQTVKHLVKELSWKRCFRTSFDSRHVNGCQMLVKYGWEHFFHIFYHSEGKWFAKYLPCWTLNSYVCLLTADDKYPVRDCENLQFPIQMQLS